MQYLVELTEEDYLEHSNDEWNLPLDLVDALQKAVPLPKGHGRLIDADEFDSRIRAAGGMAEEELTDDFKDGVLTVLGILKKHRTVVEADRGE